MTADWSLLANSCCNNCEEVREAYVRKGWSFVRSLDNRNYCWKCKRSRVDQPRFLSPDQPRLNRPGTPLILRYRLEAELLADSSPLSRFYPTQCVEEHWSDKIAAQNSEGCNVAGRVRVNKVVGNFHMSPGKSFQSNSMHVHDLVSPTTLSTIWMLGLEPTADLRAFACSGPLPPLRQPPRLWPRHQPLFVRSRHGPGRADS